MRAFTREARMLRNERVQALVTAQARSFEVDAEVQWRDGYPVPVNTPVETAFTTKVAVELRGDAQVDGNTPPGSGSEDFAFMPEHRPGCYLLRGNRDGEGTCMVHSPGYDFNGAALPVSAAYWCLLAERFLV